MVPSFTPTGPEVAGPGRGHDRNRCKLQGLATLERLHAGAWAAHGAGERPTARELAGRLGMTYDAFHKFARRLRAAGRWPWGDDGQRRPRSPRVGWDEARRLASLPESVALARRLGRIAGRRCPRLSDEYESAAMAALWDAALCHDGRSSMPFEVFAAMRIGGAIKTVGREANVQGYRDKRRAGLREGRHPTVLSADVKVGGDDGRPTSLAEEIASGDLPVGWEVDAADTVAHLAGKIPEEDARAAILAAYTRCDGDAESVARRWGGDRSEVHQARKRGLYAIRRWIEGMGGVAG